MVYCATMSSVMRGSWHSKLFRLSYAETREPRFYLNRIQAGIDTHVQVINLALGLSAQPERSPWTSVSYLQVWISRTIMSHVHTKHTVPQVSECSAGIMPNHNNYHHRSQGSKVPSRSVGTTERKVWAKLLGILGASVLPSRSQPSGSW